MPTILVIDDELVILEYLKMILTKLGYEVCTANDGKSGCDAAKNKEIRLIISDLNMPGETAGMNLIKQLRALRPDCPVIVLTGYPTTERIKETTEIGEIEFLTKPFEIPFLNIILKRLLPLNTESGPNAAGQK